MSFLPIPCAFTVELSWSDWSECSTTCGKGTKTRTASCPDNSGNKCLELVKDATQKSPCNKGRCPGLYSGSLKKRINLSKRVKQQVPADLVPSRELF